MLSERKWVYRKENLVPWWPSPHTWNKIFLCCSVIAVLLDTLFFYVPVIDGPQKCLSLDKELEITACVLRSFTDIFYILHLFFQFNNGTTSYFIIHILAALPLPQVAVLVIIPNVNGPVSLITKELLKYVIFFQYVPRSIQIFMLYEEMTRTARIFTEKAWAGAALNLVLYILASHVVGVLWYAFTIEREVRCWRDVYERDNRDDKYLYCGKDRVRHYAFLDASCPHLEPNEIIHSTDFDFGIFLEALQSNIVETRRHFPQKFFYCSWWGLRSLSSLGQNLRTSTYVWEILFAYSISILGLILFSLLIGNMQKCLHSYYRLTHRAEEMIEKKRDAEQLMSRCNLPQELRVQIRQYEQYRWKTTRGVELDSFIHKLPRNLRRDVKVHLCLNLIARVPICKRMDQPLLEAICDLLKPVLYAEGSFITREGQQVHEMLFIKQGTLASISINDGNVFFKSYLLKEGDFYGEELLPWALDNPSSILPTSTRRILALTNVEAFALMSNDWKFVASHFQLIHNKLLVQNFRYYSLELRTRAACFIQAMWRRHKRKLEKSLHLQKTLVGIVTASKFPINALRGLRRNRARTAILPHHITPPLQPQTPGFSTKVD